MALNKEFEIIDVSRNIRTITEPGIKNKVTLELVGADEPALQGHVIAQQGLGKDVFAGYGRNTFWNKVMPSMLARKTFVLFAIDEWVVYGIVIKSTTY